MFNLFRKKRKYPPFPVLASFDKKDYYFIRTAQWDYLDSQTIYVNDPYGPRVFTLDPWPQLVFMGANGVLTVSEYIYLMADKYDSTIPAELDKIILHELNGLLNFKIIALTQVKQQPAPGHDIPISKRKETGN